jgi:hypothetical protein
MGAHATGVCSQPLSGSHDSAVQALLSLQLSSVPPRQLPQAHVVPLVQASPSSHFVPFGRRSPRHAPLGLWQRSFVVQLLPSSHFAPRATVCVQVERPFSRKHLSVVQLLASSQSAFDLQAAAMRSSDEATAGSSKPPMPAPPSAAKSSGISAQAIMLNTANVLMIACR